MSNKSAVLCAIFCLAVILQTGSVLGNTVIFTIEITYRNGQGPYTVGQTLSLGGSSMVYGDGTSANPTTTCSVVSIAEDYAIFRGSVTKTYSTLNPVGSPYLAYITQNARIAGSKNNANVVMLLETHVDLRQGQLAASPISAQFSRVTVLKGSTVSLPIPAVDLFDSPLSFRFSLPAEMGGPTLTQPPGLSLDTDTGYLTWDTSAAAVQVGLWNTQVKVLNTLFDTPVDFMIRVIAPVKACATRCANGNAVCTTDSQCTSCAAPGQAGSCTPNSAPVMIAPTPKHGTFFCVNSGETVAFNVTAAKYDATNPNPTITILTGALPAGATMSVQTGSNPVTQQFSWTPTSVNTGKYIICFSAVDELTYMADQNCVFITVNADPYPPTVQAILPYTGQYYTDYLWATVLGSNFTNSPNIVCDFGGNTTTGVYVSATKIMCLGPPAPVLGTVPFRMSCVCDIYGQNLTWTYFGIPDLVEVQTPTPVYYDLITTNVTLVGHAFFTSVQCQVNGAVMPTYYINQTTAICTVPAYPNGIYSVLVSNDGFHNSSNPISIRILGPPTVSYVPNQLTLPGNTAFAVPVFGTKFSNVGTPTCLIDNYLREPATVVNGSFVSCDAWFVVTNGQHNMSVSNDGTLFSNVIQFTVYQTPTLDYLQTPVYYRNGIAEHVYTVGADFVDTPLLQCIIDDVSVPFVYLNSSTLRCSPGPLNNGIHTVNVQNNPSRVAAQTLTFLVLGSPLVFYVPNQESFPESVAFQLPVFGSGFSNIGVPGCIVDGFLTTTATIINSSYVTCDVWLGLAAGGNHNVTVTNDGNIYSNTTTFWIYSIPVISFLQLPTYYPDFINTVVGVAGSKFMNTSQLRCLVNSVSVPFVFVNSTTLVCYTRQLQNGVHSITVANNPLKVSNSKSFLVLGAPSISSSSITAAYPPLTTQTITIFGARFYNSPSLACIVDGVHITASFLSTASVSCPFPPLAIGFHNLTVTNDGSHVNQTVSFPVYGVPILSYATFPSYYPNNLSLLVLVKGLNFYNFSSLSCYVNGTWTQAVYLNATFITCALPPKPNGFYALSVTNDRVYSSNRLPYVVLGRSQISCLQKSPYPAHASVDLPIGGDNMMNAGSAICLVNGYLTQTVTIYNATYAVCHVPPLGIGNHNVSVSNDGVHFSQTLTWIIRGIPDLVYVYPQFILGDTPTDVYISSQFFVNTTLLTCHIGNVIYPAEFLNTSMALCHVPARTVGSVSVSVSNDGLNMGDSYQLSVIDLYPSAASTLGGTLVTLFGKWSPNPSNAICNFAGVVTKAVSWNGTENNRSIVCFVPPRAGLSDLDLVVGNDNGATISIALHLYDEPLVLSVFPANISSSTGSQITVSGSGFGVTGLSQYGLIETPMCFIIGKLQNVTVPATVLSNGEVTCDVPPLLGGSYNVSISLTGLYHPLLTSSAFSVIYDLRTVVGPVPGGISIFLSGVFSSQLAYQCQFADVTLVAATLVNTTMIACQLPAHEEATVAVRVVSNVESVASAPLFRYLALGFISDSFALNSGGSTLTITGRSFTDDPSASNVTCWFNQTMVPAINGSNIECPIPAAGVSVEGQVYVTVRDDSGWFASWPFIYYDMPQVALSSLFVKQNNSVPVNVTISSTVSTVRPMLVTLTCASCHFAALVDTPVVQSLSQEEHGSPIALLRHHSFSRLSTRGAVPLAGSSQPVRYMTTWQGVVQAGPLTVLDSVLYEPLEEYWGTDSVTVTIRVLDHPSMLENRALAPVQIGTINHAPKFETSRLYLPAVSGTYTKISGWAANMSAGPDYESWQTMHFTVSLAKNGHLFTIPPSVDRVTGDLEFSTPYTSEGEMAVVTVTLWDNGGTLFGGLDHSVPVNVSITFLSTLVNETHWIIPLVVISMVLVCLCIVSFFLLYRWFQKQHYLDQIERAPLKSKQSMMSMESETPLKSIPHYQPNLGRLKSLLVDSPTLFSQRRPLVEDGSISFDLSSTPRVSEEFELKPLPQRIPRSHHTFIPHAPASDFDPTMPMSLRVNPRESEVTMTSATTRESGRIAKISSQLFFSRNPDKRDSAPTTPVLRSQPLQGSPTLLPLSFSTESFNHIRSTDRRPPG